MNIWLVLSVVIALAIVGLWFMLWHSYRKVGEVPEPFPQLIRRQYPTARGYIHVTLSLAERVALLPEKTDLRFLSLIPQRKHGGDMVCFAMTRTEFNLFYATLARRVSVLLAQAARDGETVVRGEADSLARLQLRLQNYRAPATLPPIAAGGDYC